MITSLDLVSISDFVLAGVCLFMAGYSMAKVENIWSKTGTLSYFLLFAGLSAFMGGIDHGFFEPLNLRYVPRTMTYLFIAAGTFFLFKYIILTYTKGRSRNVLNTFAYLQLSAFVIASFLYHHFLLVIANFSPVLILFFILNLINIRINRSASAFSLYCVVMVFATLIQVLEVKLSPLVNEDTLSHIIAIVAHLFMFSGIRKISRDCV